MSEFVNALEGMHLLTHSPNHLLTHSSNHLLTHSPNHLLTHLLTQDLQGRLDKSVDTTLGSHAPTQHDISVTSPSKYLNQSASRYSKEIFEEMQEDPRYGIWNSRTRSLTYSLTYLLTHSPTHSPKLLIALNRC
jgi:hypothetical protein